MFRYERPKRSVCNNFMSSISRLPSLAAKSRGRDNHFNLIRLLAAAGVFVSHAWPLTLGKGSPEPLATTLGISLGTVCVYVFFAISGFFITKSFDQNKSRIRFILARALRLFPALAFNLSLTVIVAGLVLTSASPEVFWSEAPKYFLRNLTLAKLDYDLPGVFNDAPFGNAVNGSLWTLFYEVICYTCVFLIGLTGLLRKTPVFSVGVVLALSGCFAIASFPVRPELALLAKLASPFVIGMSLYVLRECIPIHFGLAVGLVGVAILTHESVLFLPCFLLALSYGVFWVGFAKHPMLLLYNKLGDYSYGFYIYAFPIQQIAVSQGATTPLQNIIYAFPVTLLCSVLSWHFIERPAISLLNSGYIQRTNY